MGADGVGQALARVGTDPAERDRLAPPAAEHGTTIAA